MTTSFRNRATKTVAAATLIVTTGFVGTACGSDDSSTTTQNGAASVTTTPGLVEPDQVDALIKANPGMQVIDIRSPAEIAEGRLPQATMALNFYDTDFPAQIDKLDKSGTYLVYCRSGNRSAQAAAMMHGKGLANTWDLAGGINAWADAGKQVTTAPIPG